MTARNLFASAVCAAAMLATPALAGGFSAHVDAHSGKAAPRYVITNDDVNSETIGPNTITVYVPGKGPGLTQKVVIKTGGGGVASGNVGTPRLAILYGKTDTCLFVSDAGTNDVAAINLRSLKVVGDFTGSSGDLANFRGLGVVLGNGYLYAGFPKSSTIATFRLSAGCKLKFIGDVGAEGLNFGAPAGMAVNGETLVMTFGDGSIESFNLAKGVPVSNGDEQLSSGYEANGDLPAGVDITKDGHFAIFGDDQGDFKAGTDVEVSDLSSGKLAATTSFTTLFGGFNNSNEVRLSPDETLLFANLSYSGAIGAAFFDAKTGIPSFAPDCVASLRDFGGGSQPNYSSGLTAGGASGSGNVVYIGEWNTNENVASAIGVVKAEAKGGKCKIAESADSPANDPQSTSLRALIAFPPRPF